MTTAIFRDGMPLTEAEYLALEATSERIELFDGSLVVTPAPTPRHQHISSELLISLRPAAREAGLFVHEAVNVRLRSSRIPIPDLTVTEHIDYDEPVIDVSAVRLVCEIVSPSNASTDRVFKMHYYAAAGIPWYLLVEQETGTLHLYRLVNSTYIEQSVTKDDETLRLTEPFPAVITPRDLLPPS